MIIHSFDHFDEVRDLDPETGALTPVAEGTPGPGFIRGHYGLLADGPVVLYRSAGTLLLRVGDVTTPVDDTRVVSHEGHGRQHVLRVTDRRTGGVVVSLDYTLPAEIVAPEDDPTPFAEAEDFDLGLFITNVANDRGRRERIYRDPDEPG